MIKAILDFIFKVMVLGVLFAIWSHYAEGCEIQSKEIEFENDVVITTIILEAGGEYQVGALEAVYEVIMNRAKKRNKTPAQVCLQKWQFSCWNGKDIQENIKKAKRHPRWLTAKNILGKETNYTNGADHYHADYIDDPYWAKSMKVTVKIGKHIFYK
jgi:spore germination cell wall hydrolase CwlJ-like protein